ncbi:MAG: glycosyltransferase family 2 protein [Fulvivirga sp.]
MKPDISIIVATYNRAHLIEKALRSVQQQTFQKWQCLIIDDGSTDNTLELVVNLKANDNRFSYYARPEYKKKGPSSCRNYGMELAKGKYIQFFDDDDFMYPELLEHKIEAIKKNNVDVVVSPHQLYNVEQRKETKINKIYSENLIEDYITGRLTWYCSGPMWNTKFLKERFDEEIQTLEDWDFNLRCIYNKPRVHYLHKPLQRYNRYRKGETLSTKAQLGDERQIISGFKAYKKHFLLLEQKGILTKEVRYWLINRFIFLLRAAVSSKYKVSKEIYLFLKIRFYPNEFIKYRSMFLAYYAFKYFKTGYRLFKIK